MMSSTSSDLLCTTSIASNIAQIFLTYLPTTQFAIGGHVCILGGIASTIPNTLISTSKPFSGSDTTWHKPPPLEGFNDLPVLEYFQGQLEIAFGSLLENFSNNPQVFANFRSQDQVPKYQSPPSDHTRDHALN
jgi:hypothetical protein